MSRLTVTPDTTPGQPELRTEDPATIAATLKQVGVRFERWDLPVAAGADADNDSLLAAYRPHLDRLMGETAAGTADVLRMRPGNENYPAMRKKFIDEHTHSEDEVRFFVSGSGNFMLHLHGKVYDVHCTAGDLISVPAGTKHWYDGGAEPNCTVLRVFTETTGWAPHYTGEKISELFPAA